MSRARSRSWLRASSSSGTFSAGDAAGQVAFGEQNQLVVVGRLLQPAAGAHADPTVEQIEGQRVLFDQPGRALGDCIAECPQAGRHVLVRIDALADVVQKGGQAEFLVVGQHVRGQREDLQAVIEHVPLGVPPVVLLDLGQRREQVAINAKAVRAFGQWPLGIVPLVGQERGAGVTV